MPRLRKLIMLLSILVSVFIGALICYFSLSALNKLDNNISLTIAVSDKTATYTGSPIYADSYEITDGKLSTGDSLELTYTGSITNVGSTISSAVAKVYSSSGNDVTSDYSITVVTGTIYVMQSALTLHPKGAVDYNNGEFIDEASFEISSGTIGNNERIVPYLAETYTRGAISATIKAKIYNLIGEDVTSNYVITYDSNDLVINRIPLVITTQSATKTYDGSALTNSNYLINGLLSTDSLDTSEVEPSSITDYSDVGVTNTIDRTQISIIDTTTKNDVTSAYSIVLQNVGLLYIKKKSVTITTESYSGQYSQSNTFKSESFECSDSDAYDYLLGCASFKEFSDAGVYINTVSFSSDDIINYDITYNLGIVNISKKVINVYLPTIYGSISDTSSSLSENFESSNIIVSDYDLLEIAYELQIEIPEYDFSVEGTYNYGAILVSDYDNYEIIVHPGTIVIA